jgi:hypothetical protein
LESKDSVNPRWDVVGDAVRELAVWQKEQKVYRYTKYKYSRRISVRQQSCKEIAVCQDSLVSRFKSFNKCVAENDDLLVSSLEIYEKLQ